MDIFILKSHKFILIYKILMYFVWLLSYLFVQVKHSSAVDQSMAVSGFSVSVCFEQASLLDQHSQQVLV